MPQRNYLQVTLEKGALPASSPRDHELSGWRPAEASLSQGRGESLVLADSPSGKLSSSALVGNQPRRRRTLISNRARSDSLALAGRSPEDAVSLKIPF